MKQKYIIITISVLILVALGTTMAFLQNSNHDDKRIVEKKMDSSKFKPQGEIANATSERNKIMDAKSGAPITETDVMEARENMRKQGIQDGPFSNLDIAKVIDMANSESLDYKTAIEKLYPNYFE